MSLRTFCLQSFSSSAIRTLMASSSTKFEPLPLLLTAVPSGALRRRPSLSVPGSDWLPVAPAEVISSSEIASRLCSMWFKSSSCSSCRVCSAAAASARWYRSHFETRCAKVTNQATQCLANTIQVRSPLSTKEHAPLAALRSAVWPSGALRTPSPSRAANSRAR